MEQKFNTLQFELFDAVAAGEEWALEHEYRRIPAVKILIDGRDLNAMIVEIEARSKGREPPPSPDKEYGHMSAGQLLFDLKKKNSFDGEPFPVELNCCPVCGEPMCWGVTAEREERAQEVVWRNFEHEFIDCDYGLEFHFEKAAYEAALGKLEELAREAKRIAAEAKQEWEQEIKELKTCQPAREEPVGSAAARKFNTLQFEPFDAAAAGEKWAVREGRSRTPAVRILVDGRDLNELIVEAEARFEGKATGNPGDEYGHMSARLLLSHLRPDESLKKQGRSFPDLSCSPDSGRPIQWGVYAACLERQQEVVWFHFTHYRVKRSVYPYDFEFHFEKSAYEAALDKLAELAREEDRVAAENRKLRKKEPQEATAV